LAHVLIILAVDTCRQLKLEGTWCTKTQLPFYVAYRSTHIIIQRNIKFQLRTSEARVSGVRRPQDREI
jgi:hypothetical protein